MPPPVSHTPLVPSNPHRPVHPIQLIRVPPGRCPEIHTPQHPPAGRSHGYSHHPHAGRNVQRVDGDAVEEAGDGASLKARDTGRNQQGGRDRACGQATWADSGSWKHETPSDPSTWLLQHPDVSPLPPETSKANTTTPRTGEDAASDRRSGLPRLHGQGAAGPQSWLALGAQRGSMDIPPSLCSGVGEARPLNPGCPQTHPTRCVA